MADRSSRPHHSPTRTPPGWSARIVHLRWRHRLGPVQIAGRLGMPASTVHAVLVRCRINRLTHIDRVTGEPLRRYEHDHPGSLIHVDVTKFGNIPDGGGWRFVGRVTEATATAAPPPDAPAQRGKHYQPADRHRVRAHRHRRPLPRRLRRDPRRRESRHRHRCPAARRGLVRRPRRHRRTRAVRQRLGLPVPRLARRLRRARHHPRSAPGPTGHRPTARSNASTAPWPTAGPTPASTTQKPNAEPPCPAGSTSTITTDPTPPSEASHRSPD